jgi:DNA-binding NtrC family response regulator
MRCIERSLPACLTLQVHELREQLENWHGIQAVLIGRSAQMESVRRTILALAATPADVLIYGETGTGKEMVARCLHDLLNERLSLTPGDSEMPQSLPEQIEYFERALITAKLRRYHGEVTATAKALGLPKQTLYDKLRRLKLATEDFHNDECSL